MSKRLFVAVWAVLTLSVNVAWAECGASAGRYCADAPSRSFASANAKPSLAQLDAEIRAIEPRVREMLPWDPGESRLFLWASAIIAFTAVMGVAPQVLAAVAGFLARLCFGRGGSSEH